MRAAWYERQGTAVEVLEIGDMPTPDPGPGEVRVRLSMSGINPGDVKKRQGYFSSSMTYPRVIPHSDGAGVIDAVGPGVDRRPGQRVWTYGAQSYRPFGTAAEMTVVPSDLAVDLPEGVSDQLGASLGIPGITAHRAVFADGPVVGKIVMVQGVLGGVGSLAAQLAHWSGATVIGTVRSSNDLDKVDANFVHHAVALDGDAAADIRALAPRGVDRIVEVALSANAELDAAVITNDGMVATYASIAGLPQDPFWHLLFVNATIRLLGSDDFPPTAKAQAAQDLSAAAASGALRVRTAPLFPLSDVAAAHDAVEAGARNGRVLLDVRG